MHLVNPDKNPWYHSGMSRDLARALVLKFSGGEDGVFIVRDNLVKHGTFILTYNCSGKVYHTPILLLKDPGKCATVYSCDHGLTKFPELDFLIRFYFLNKGVLQTRLSYFIVDSSLFPPEYMRLKPQDAGKGEEEEEADGYGSS